MQICGHEIVARTNEQIAQGVQGSQSTSTKRNEAGVLHLGEGGGGCLGIVITDRGNKAEIACDVGSQGVEEISTHALGGGRRAAWKLTRAATIVCRSGHGLAGMCIG